MGQICYEILPHREHRRAFILFLLILWVFEINKKWTLTPTDASTLATAYKIYANMTRKLKFKFFFKITPIQKTRTISL